MKKVIKPMHGPVEQGFTLIELMIVIAIMAISVSLAVPAYQDFTIRARVTEGLSVSASAKVAVSVPCQVSPTTVPTNASTGYANSGSEFVQSVTISNTCEEPWIVIRTRNTGASPDVVLSLDGYFNPGTGRISWNCHMVRGDKQYLPGSCRGGHL